MKDKGLKFECKLNLKKKKEIVSVSLNMLKYVT